MIARHETQLDRMDIWSKLAAPVPAGTISWRQDGRPTQRDGKYFARFVCYIEANTVRERLDAVVPGEWDLTLELLPPVAGEDGEGNCSFKARLQILGVIREDVGTGRDYKSAATDAFKRVAVRFGIGHELYAYEQNWVQVDGDGRFARPLEDPAVAYARRHGGTGRSERAAARAERKERAETTTVADAEVEHEHGGVADHAPERATGPRASDEPSCPKCGGRMWDNRATKRNPKAPDFKCRDRSCDGVIWPPRPGQNGQNGKSTELEAPRNGAAPLIPETEESLAGNVDDLPF